MLASPPKYVFAAVLHNKKAPNAATIMLIGTPAFNQCVCVRVCTGIIEWKSESEHIEHTLSYRVHKFLLVTFPAQII